MIQNQLNSTKYHAHILTTVYEGFLYAKLIILSYQLFMAKI